MNKRFGLEAASESVLDSAVSAKGSWRDFVSVTKPRIIFFNLIAAFGGFWIASKWNVDWLLFIFTLLGAALIMASSAALNNYWDRDLDRKMTRTQTRALPAGKLKPNQVLWFGIVLGIAGLAVLFFCVNPLTALLGLIGIFVYFVVYTVWLKRTSTLSTAVGAVSGAMPPVIGYCAVSQQMDAGAWILFAMLFLWQPPHFWSLGIRRKEEYRAAGFPLLPVVKGVKRTKLQMIPYIVLLIPVSTLLYIYEYVGIVYFMTALFMGIAWLYLCLTGLKAEDDEKWAKSNFMFSNNYLLIVFVMMILNTLPA